MWSRLWWPILLTVFTVSSRVSGQQQYYQQYQYQQYQPQYFAQQPQWQPQLPPQLPQLPQLPQPQPLQPPQQLVSYQVQQPPQQQQPVTLPPLQPLPIARQPLPQQSITNEQIQYLQQTDPSRKARRFIASYWDPQKQQTIFYERVEPSPPFSPQQQFQFQPQPQFPPPPPPPPSPSFIPQQTFPHPFFRQFQQPQQIDPLSGQLVAPRPPPPPPTALHLPPTSARTSQSQKQIIRGEQQGFPEIGQPRSQNSRFPSQRLRPPQGSMRFGDTEVRAPPPPGKFSPYPQDVFDPLDTKLSRPTPPTPPEVLVSGGSMRGNVEHSAIEAIPRELSSHQSLPPPPPRSQRPQRPQPPPVQKQTFQPKSQQQRPTHKTALSKQPPPPIQPLVSSRPVSVLEQTLDEPMDANTVFLQCCQKRKVDKKCESRCNFDVMNKKMLMAMFLGTDPCPQSYGRDLLSCAAQELDHTQCCIERGVHETSAGKKCLGFCNMTPDNSFQADASMLPCWAVLNDIKGCFRDNLEDSL